MPLTSLPWEAYRTQANTLRGQGLNFPQIYKKLGTPFWDNQQWRLEMDKGKIKRKRQSTRDANKKSYTKTRQQRDVSKTEDEARQFNQLKKQASAESDNLIHQIAGGGKPSVAEHDVALRAGGSKEHASISDPLIEQLKNAVEQHVYTQKPHYIVDIDNVSGGIRLVHKNRHNKFEPTSQQKGVTIEHYEDWRPIVDALPIVTRDRQLEQTLKGTPQEQVSLPQTTATTPRQNLTPQSSAPQSKVTPPQAAPEPKVNMAPQVMSAETNGNGNGNGAYEINGNGNGNGGTYLNGNGNYVEGIAHSAQLFGQLTTAAVGAIGMTLLKQIDPTRALN